MNCIPYSFNHSLDRLKHDRYNRLDVLPRRSDLFVNPVHNTGDDNVDRFKNRLKQIPESIQQRRNEVVNCLPYSCDNRPDCIQHRADRCMNRVPYDRDNGLNEIDFFRYTVINRRPDTDKEILDTRPDSCEKVLDRVEDGAYEVLYTVPDVHKEVLDARPDAYPEVLYFTKIGTENTADHIQRIFQRILDEIPYSSKDALDTVPHSAPIAGKDADENIQNAQDDVCHSFEDICNLLELPLKDRFQEFAETVPYRLDDLGDIFEIEAQRIDAVNNALTKAGKDTLDLLPDRRDLIAEVLIRAP